MLKHKPCIYSTYYEQIYSYIEQFEAYRRKLLKFVIIRGILIIPSAIFCGFIYYQEHSNIFLATVISVILAYLLEMINFCAPPEQKAFRNKLKEDCFHFVIKTFIDISLWQRNKAASEIIPDTELHRSGLFEIFTHRKNDDEFSGIYNNVPFSVSECELIFDTGINKPKTIFEGLILKFKSNKKIKQRTIIASKKELQLLPSALLVFLLTLIQVAFKTENILTGAIAAIIGFIIVVLTLRLNLTKKEKKSDIKLEDILFLKKYKVFSEDEVESRYLLSTTFIEKFTKLEKIMESERIKCSFYDDSIMIAIPSDKDFFEIGNIYKNVQEAETIENFHKDVSIIFELIDHFKLDTKIGL